MTERTAKPLPCPSCSRPMEMQTQEGVSIEVCLVHGIWLDAGELEEIIGKITARHALHADRLVEKAKRRTRAQAMRSVSDMMSAWWAMFG